MASNLINIQPIMKLLEDNRPIESIADVGCGFGLYGALCRVYLEKSPHLRDTWKIDINGYDIHLESVQLFCHFYNRIKIKDIRSVDICGYDVVLLISVIEHMSREEALKLLTNIIGKNKWVILSTPNGYMPSPEVYDNPFNEHISGFSIEDLQRLGLRVRKNEGRLIAYSKDMRTVRIPWRRKILSHKTRTKLLKILGRQWRT